MSKEPISINESTARTEQAPIHQQTTSPYMAERALHGTGTTPTQKGDTLTNPAGGQNDATMPAGVSTDEKFRLIENEIRNLKTALDRTMRDLETARALIDKLLSVFSVEGAGQQGTVTISAGTVNVVAAQTARMTASTVDIDATVELTMDAAFDMKLKAGSLLDLQGNASRFAIRAFTRIESSGEVQFDVPSVRIMPAQSPAARLSDVALTPAFALVSSPVRLHV